MEEALSITIFNAVEETHVQVQLSVKGETVAHSHGTVLGEDPHTHMLTHRNTHHNYTHALTGDSVRLIDP